MTFAWPHLLGLLVVPLGLVLWELRHRRRAAAASHPKILRAQASPAAVELTSLPSAPGQFRTRFWLCAGLALAVVALARPQWGQLEEPVYDQSREILLAVDLSRSMLTPDVKPSRLDRTKLLIQSLLEKLAGERVGLVVFSGTSFLQAPLSADYEILREFLPSLSPAFLPEGGTNYGAMLDTAVQAFGATGAADRFLVVLSDGEATDPGWKEHLDPLTKKGIRVLALGVGTAGGDMIPEADGGFVKDERGAVVLSKLESSTLQELARATGGVYRDASSWIDLAGLVSETIEAGRKGEFVEKNTIRLVERFQWPLAFGLWCFLVSFYYEFPVRPKPRTIALKGSSAVKTPASLPPTAALLCALLAALALPAPILRAAAKLAPAPTSAAPGEPTVLSKIVGRISASDQRTARDWAELSRETITWGSRLRSEQQSVPEGPVRDALAAVDLGEKLEAAATDWNKLRTELEALLQKKDPEDKKDQDKDQKDQKQQQDKNQKQDKSKPEEKNPEQSPEEQQQQSQDKSQPSDSAENKSQPKDQQKKEDPELGEMKKQEGPPPPPPSENTQQVGGGQEKKAEESKEPLDPALAPAMQKLDQLRSQDSPAILFQLMDGDRKADRKSGPKTGKNW
jgi:Ca-activated chloride channel family protein